jgi:hypothetical protein
MQADLKLALATAQRLSRMYRVVTDDDLHDLLPQVPRHLRSHALNQLVRERVLHPRKGRVGHDSGIYVGSMEHSSGVALTV